MAHCAKLRADFPFQYTPAPEGKLKTQSVIEALYAAHLPFRPLPRLLPRLLHRRHHHSLLLLHRLHHLHHLRPRLPLPPYW